jgi:hypothetical protein
MEPPELMSVELTIVSAALIVVVVVVVVARIAEARSGVDNLMAHIESNAPQSKPIDVTPRPSREPMEDSTAADSGAEDLRSLTDAVSSHKEKTVERVSDESPRS